MLTGPDIEVARDAEYEQPVESVQAAVGLVLSIVAIVLLVRLHPRTYHQDEAVQPPSPAGASAR